MKNLLKISVLIVLIIFTLTTIVYGDWGLNDLTGDTSKTGGLKSAGADVLTYLAIIASAISIIAMIALGIKYMLGSVEEKAEYKKTLLPYFIGACFVFGATTIASTIYNMVK